MNKLKMLAAALLAFFATPALGSTFALQGWTAQAGQPETLTILRTSGTSGAYVTLRTGASGDTAKPITDYAATSVTVYVGRYQKSSAVHIATLVNPAQLGKTLRFTAAISVGGITVSSASVAIVEPPATVTCPDGQQIPAGSSCPVAPPPPPPPPASGTALALQSCPALNRPENIVAGRTYTVDEFGHDAGGSEFVALSDATHLGDGYFALYVPVACVQIAP